MNFQNHGLHLFLGPAWSGKTSFVTNLLPSTQPVTWLGTAMTDDPAMLAHLTHLKEQRPSSWKTFDCPFDLIDILRAQNPHQVPIVIDSASQWIANIAVIKTSKYDRGQLSEILQDCTNEFIEQIILQKKHRTVIVVSAEMGSSMPPADPTSYLIRKTVGLLNQKIACEASVVNLIHAGIGQTTKSISNS